MRRTVAADETVPVGRHDTVTALGLWVGLFGATLVLATTVFGLPTAIGVFGVVALLAGVLLVGVGSTMARRATGDGWVRCVLRGGRTALHLAVDLLP